MMTPKQMQNNLQEEAYRLVMRYCHEVVVHFNFCPWARSAIQENRLDINVLEDSQWPYPLDKQLPTELIRQGVQRLALLEVEPQVELVLLVFPTLPIDRIPFDDVLREVRRYHELERQTSGFAFAAFHPSAQANFFSPERMIPFIRRTPFPIIQAVKVEVLNQIAPKQSGGTAYIDPDHMANFNWKQLSQPEPLRKKIARANLETIKKSGVESVEHRLKLIFRERDAFFKAQNQSVPSQWG